MTAMPADIPQALAATAGPGEVVPVAFLGRTSNERLQDPVASMRRQVRNSRAWLPPGCQIVAYYWDVESGGDDLEDRGHGDAWQIAAAAGIPRDGGIADLLNEAASPTPNFAFVVCEDIERSARDTYNSLKLERQLQDQGIPIFATDEPFNIEGINATTILVRRVKQGVAEWYRLQLKGKVWDGLKEHSLAGWNLGKVPIGYTGQKHPHPNPIKAAEGRTKTRLIEDPVYGPVITQIYSWRVSEHLGKPTIRARLAADPITYPPPGPAGWSLALVDEILSNPKYTGHQVMGRRRRKAGKKVWMPASEWIWSAEPTHPALVNMAAWDAAQRIGRRHGNVRDPEMPARRTGRRYKLRSRLYCSICHRRHQRHDHPRLHLLPVPARSRPAPPLRRLPRAPHRRRPRRDRRRRPGPVLHRAGVRPRPGRYAHRPAARQRRRPGRAPRQASRRHPPQNRPARHRRDRADHRTGNPR